MKKQMTKTLFVVLAITSMFLVGCGGKENVTDTSTETGTETIVAELETSTQDNQETSSENERVAETETPTEESTQTEEPTPTPEPTETPTQEITHTHSYTENVTREARCRHYIATGELTEEQACGEKIYTCDCGHSYEEVIDAFIPQRDYDFVVIQSPTCFDPGWQEDHCIYCGEVMVGEVIEATGNHVLDTVWNYIPSTKEYRLGCVVCETTIQKTFEKPEGVEIRIIEWNGIP